MAREDAASARKPLMGYDEVVVQEEDSKCCSCTPSWVKTFVIFFTAILLLVSLGLISLGAYLVAVRLSFIPILLGEVAYMSHFLLFVVGALLTIGCIVGFVGVSKKEPGILMAYFWLLVLVVLVQLTTGILALCFSDVFHDWLASRMQRTMQNRYAANEFDVDGAVDYVQQKFKCCGSVGYRDWNSSVFQHAYDKRPYGADGAGGGGLGGYELRVPDSCCIRRVDDCGVVSHPSNVYYEGCISTVLLRLRDSYYTICVVVLSLIAVELVGATLAYCYAEAVKQHY